MGAPMPALRLPCGGPLWGNRGRTPGTRWGYDQDPRLRAAGYLRLPTWAVFAGCALTRGLHILANA